MFACWFAVADRRESDACLNLSILNRWCFWVCSCTGGLHGLSMVVSKPPKPTKDMTESRLRGDDPKVEASSSWELAPRGGRCSSCTRRSDGLSVLWRRRPALGVLARRRVQGITRIQWQGDHWNSASSSVLLRLRMRTRTG